MKALYLLLICIIFAGFASAGICENIISEFGFKAGVSLPSYVPYKNERFNIYTLDDEPVGHMITEDGKILSLNCTLTDDPTFIVRFKDESTIGDIRSSSAPVKTYKMKVKAGEISLSAIGFPKSVKLFFTNIGLSIASWFGR